MKMNVPIKETGIAIAGIKVERQFCKNKKIITITSAIVIRSEIITPSVPVSTKLVVSNASCF